MPAPLTLFEYETLRFPWEDRHLTLLERLNAASGGEVLRATVRRGERVLQATHYVGVLRLGNQTVQVLPKIYREAEANTTNERDRLATRNLLQLLGYAEDVAIHEDGPTPLHRQPSDWFELLTRIFATHLGEEWQRGPQRAYQTVEDELPLLKGQWQIARQLRRPERRHRFTVAYDEWSADNQLNRVFRFVVERLWHLSRDSPNRRLLGNLRQAMEEVTLLGQIQASDAPPTLITRLNRRYLPLLNLARLFLAGSSLQLLTGDTTSWAFVFDMNLLWEGFIAAFIRRHRAAVLPPALADCDLLPQTRGASRFLVHSNGHHFFRLKPDLALRQGNIFPVLIDTKYKRLDPTDGVLGVAQADLYQMHAYAMRYACPLIVLIYPATNDALPMQTLHWEHTPQQRVVVGTVPMGGDLSHPSTRTAIANRLRQLIEGATV